MKNNNNKKRVLPLLLAVLLLIGAGAYGTRAFFTDQEELKTSIKIESGTLDIVVDNASWIYAPLKNIDATKNTYFQNDRLEYSYTDLDGKTISATGPLDGKSIGSDNVVVKNARPGDAFTRTITITNKGKLDVIIPNTFVANLGDQSNNQLDPNYANLKDLFIATFKLDTTNGIILAESKEILLIPEQAVTYTMNIEVNHALNYNSGLPADIDTIAKFALENIVITAKQPNDGEKYDITIKN